MNYCPKCNTASQEAHGSDCSLPVSETIAVTKAPSPLRDAFNKYGQHLRDCASLEPNDVSGEPKSCTCGFIDWKEGD